MKFLPKCFTIVQEITFFSTILRCLTSEIFPILTRSAWTLKITMLNKSGYFRTLASMIESTALDFWRKSKKPEIESYIIDHDFRKIQVKNTGSYWILPYIYLPLLHSGRVGGWDGSPEQEDSCFLLFINFKDFSSCHNFRLWMMLACFFPLVVVVRFQLSQPLLDLIWVGFDVKMGLHTTPPPPHPPKLNFHHKEPQINLWCCLNNNINIKDKNNKNNIANDNKNKNKNNHWTKQLQNNWVVTSS